MNPLFGYSQYRLKRQILALTGIVRIYNPQGEMLLYSRQRMFRLKKDIRVYRDEEMSQEILQIRARQVLDFSAAYDVVDSLSGHKVGALRRRGWQSLARDEWQILSADDTPIGLIQEDTLGRALLRRFLLGAWLPQHYEATLGTVKVADFRQRFHLFRYEMEIDFSADPNRQLDRRLGLAAAILFAIIKGKQSS
ncbi:hypothetical protein SE15_01640 [Thermanaerothrix daxensis]|uniref:Scramblase n=1 Tax=Thermanaerothrix daxensis TaxID=869279 RepID=A0A0P6XKI4_9CHLR|nr:hypothetical protein [Thermanaerothrix daxensis]KPL83940.1 hypothetical protein SE15_01640 [Thermanaerothrix daxensis]